MKKISFIFIFILLCVFHVEGPFAATPAVMCDMSTPLIMVNTCAPDVTLNVASTEEVFDATRNRTAQSSIVAPLFNTSFPIIRILSDESHISFYGMSNSSLFGGVNKRILVNITNWPNSSSVGISQLLSSNKKSPIIGFEGNIFFGFGPINKFEANTCVENYFKNLHPLSPVIKCDPTSFTFKPDLVLSHVEPSEYEALKSPQVGKLGKLSKVNSTPLFLAGFGIAVNENLYKVLQEINKKNGILASTCSVGDKSGECQPSISRAQLSSLLSKEGILKSGFNLSLGDTTPLTINQADITHSGKAAQNILMLNNPCGRPTGNSRPNASLTPLSYQDSTDILQVTDNFTSFSDISTSISTGSGYQIGLIPLSNDALFIKLDSSSPNFDSNGKATFLNRSQTANGINSLTTTMFLVRSAKEDLKVKVLADLFWTTLRSSVWTELKGIVYLDGAAEERNLPSQSNVQRLQNTNCSPIINIKNSPTILTSFLPPIKRPLQVINFDQPSGVILKTSSFSTFQSGNGQLVTQTYPVLKVGSTTQLFATTSSGLAVSFDAIPSSACSVNGNLLTAIDNGYCSVTAKQNGNESYSSALPISQIFLVMTPQTISFLPPVGNDVFSIISAQSTSGLPISFTVSPTSSCSLSDAGNNTAHLSGVGTCVITAYQNGGGTILPAQNVSKSVYFHSGLKCTNAKIYCTPYWSTNY